MNQPPSEAFLRFVLRVVGTASLFALIAVVMPYTCMDAIHRWLGLGALPDEPIVGYLARSLSAFYALMGGLLWSLSRDLRRHRPTLCFLGVAFMISGAALIGIDYFVGLPRWWWAGEGSFTMLIGAAIAWPAFRMEPSPPYGSRATG